MNSNSIRIVIVGAGFAGTYALRKLHKIFQGRTDIAITLVNERNYFLFTPLLHEVATGSINPANIVEPIRKVLGACLRNFHMGKAMKIRLRDRIVETRSKELSYDYLVLAPGADTNFYGIPGAREHAFTLKTLEDAVRLKNHMISTVETASYLDGRDARKNKLRFVVVGGGPTGVELVAEMQEFLRGTFAGYYPTEVIRDIEIILIQRGSELLPQFSEGIRKKSLATLRAKGIEVRLGAIVAEVGRGFLKLENGEKILAETVAWVAGVVPSAIKFDEAPPRAKDGRILVDDMLRLVAHPEVFVIGDLAFAPFGPDKMPLPALAQVAVQEGEAVARSIGKIINGGLPDSFRYRHLGNLVSLGQWMAVGEIASMTFWGHITWWLWRTVYLFKLISWRKRFRVAIDWTMNLFLPRDISEL